MASFCRSALTAGSRCISARSRSLNHSSLNAISPKVLSSPFASSTKANSSSTRFISVLGSAESMMPFHSAIASPRLNSTVAFDFTCWSCLSQGLLDTS
ncbi:hypothetical protein RchiOBHm_Chr5g0010131 [Rosa chinensis]|uniref:Protein NUCLEAR FUSION DEFECTIVE 6, chloroplastic/mitochondrial-like n=1 Tax=Rosa chinensis TaxID=74649 RepID=A0A2P6Q4H7_ROSCH|nr:hypothetical protein RchiOBHm_Chr5g0010131 [Rosa chinensis]